MDSVEMVAAHCRSCGSAELDVIGPCADYPPSVASAGEPGLLLRCRRCHLGQRQPCLDGEALAAAYRQTPAEAMDYRFEDNCAWVAARDFLRQRWNPEEARDVLDIGCHTGAFLAGLPAAWRRFGVESAEGPIEIAKRDGVTLIAPTIESVAPEWRGRFDAVSLFDVLEHLPDPADGLARAATLLKPGGLLLASTADMDAWTWRLAKGGHWYLQSPLHLSVASMPFFFFVAERQRLRLAQARRIAHRAGAASARWRDRIAMLHWELRRRGGCYRLPQRMLQALPGLQKLRHRVSVPWAMHLRDHVIVVLARPVEARGETA